jgi:hypothetical protein
MDADFWAGARRGLVVVPLLWSLLLLLSESLLLGVIVALGLCFIASLLALARS